MVRSKKYRAVLAFVAWTLLCAGCLSGGNDAPGDDRGEEPSESETLLEGREQSFLIVGYSTSFAWPTILQEMLDKHSEGRRVYHVLNATVGGAPVEQWIADPGTPEYARTFQATVDDFLAKSSRLRGDAPFPETALCQQSLQLTGSDRGPVKTEHDMVGAEAGADALELMALRLRDAGIERVVIGMHIFKKPVEPEVGNERIALARLLARGHEFVRSGPDLWSVTRDCYPECFEDDGLHPNEEGTKRMAEQWYRTVAGSSVREEIVEQMLATSYDHRALMQQYLAWRRGDRFPRDTTSE